MAVDSPDVRRVPLRIGARLGVFLAILAVAATGGWQSGRLLGPAVLPESATTSFEPSTGDHTAPHPATLPREGR